MRMTINAVRLNKFPLHTAHRKFDKDLTKEGEVRK